MAYHLWFLVVFLLLVAATPLAVAADRRWGLAVPVALTVAVAVIDVAHIGADVPYVGYLNYVLGWAVSYQLGIAWRNGRLPGRRPILLAVGAAVALAVLVVWGPYPVSMIGVPGEDVQNTGPPTLALVAFAATQAGLLLAVAPAVNRRLTGSRVRGPLAVANSAVMGLYLWHMVPVVVVAVIGYPTGLLPQPPMGSGEWWLLRLVWIGAIAVVAAVLMAVLRWQRAWTAAPLPSLTVPLRPPWGLATLLVGTVVAAAAILRFTVDGCAPGGRFPLAATLLFAVGAVLVALTPRVAGAVDQPGRGSRTARPG